MFVHRLGPPGGAAQQRADAGEQLVQVVGFEHVVVRPRIQPFNALGYGVAGSGDQNRGAVLAGAQVAQHGDAVALGQTQVQQHEVVGLGAQGGVGRIAVTRPVHSVVFGAQQVLHGFADHGVVFN
ncbi:hypothetical protein D3C72_1585710 [compost metagenome]